MYPFRYDNVVDEDRALLAEARQLSFGLMGGYGKGFKKLSIQAFLSWNKRAWTAATAALLAGGSIYN